MKKLRCIVLICSCFLVTFMLSACSVTAPDTNQVDYTNQDNWAYYAKNPDKPADLFLICPTVDMGTNGNYNMSMDDTETKENFVGALNMELGIYDDNLTVYAPYYRQASFPVYSLPEEERTPYLGTAYEDVRRAFIQYVKNTPIDRPFVIAGFSQGADMTIRLLKEFCDDPAYQDRLIAAYCIGWTVSDEDMASNPWIKTAQSADDLGTIISFSSEAEETRTSLIVPSGSTSREINPLNWKTDSTPADASENLGACFTNYTGEIVEEVPALTGAYLDDKRGTLKLPDVIPEDYSNSLFPDGVYHLYDYQFFYRNLEENVKLRTETYFTKKKQKAA